MNKLIGWIGLLALVMDAAPCFSAASRPLGQLLNVTGTVEIQRAGQPVKKAKVGTKEIYFYKDLKVSFLNGKVKDIQ